MIFAELRKKEGYISGLVALERAVPSRTRASIKKFILVAAPIFMMTLFNFSNQFIVSPDFIFGAFLLITSAWLVIFMLDCFYYAHYFQGAHFSIHEWGVDSGAEIIPFEILEIVSHTATTDLTAGFLESRAGKDIFLRLGLTSADATKFITGSRQKVYADSINFPDKLTLTLYAATIIDSDTSLAGFLRANGITREFFVGTASWVSYIYQCRKESFRWWGKDALGRIKGVGKEWAVKEVYLLKEFGHFLPPQEEDITFKREIDDLERALARRTYSNALIVAKDVSEFMATVTGLGGRMEDGTALSQIVHKKLLVLDVAAIENVAQTSSGFQDLIVNILNQADFAGHIIFVIKDFPNFILSFKKRDLDVIKILAPYLSSPDIQFVAFSLQDIYEKALHNESALMSRFQRIFVERDARAVIVRALENKVFDIERKTGLFFTYQSLVAILDRASGELLVDAALEDQAMDMLKVVANHILHDGSIPKLKSLRRSKVSPRIVAVSDVVSSKP